MSNRTVIQLRRNWWEDAIDEAESEIKTQKALSATLEARARNEKEYIKATRKRPCKVSLSKMLTVAQVAELLRFEADTVREWCKNGELVSYQIGGQWRITEDALRAFISKETEKRA